MYTINDQVLHMVVVIMGPRRVVDQSRSQWVTRMSEKVQVCPPRRLVYAMDSVPPKYIEVTKESKECKRWPPQHQRRRPRRPFF